MAQILLVEPDMLLSRTYREALRKAGHTVECCSTAQAAIHSADATTPDLILLELQLVSHSGIEFLYELRSYPEWQSLPVIVLSNVPSGEFAPSWQLLHQQLGVREYLYKPIVSLQALLKTVDQMSFSK